MTADEKRAARIFTDGQSHGLSDIGTATHWTTGRTVKVLRSLETQALIRRLDTAGTRYERITA